MKIKFLALILFIFTFSFPVFSQTVVITPKKVTYRRRKPMNEFKKSFVITYPVVKAATPLLSRKIETTISYAKNTNLDLKGELGDEQWLEEASYEVNYNKNGILDITLSTSGSGAYPSTFFKTLIVNEKTGNIVRPLDVFINLPGLAARVRKAQQAEILKAKEDYKKDPESKDFDGAEYFNDAKFTAKQLENFSVDDKGITFLYDYEFPHVVQALQPDGIYFYSWAEIKPYIKRASLLGQFIR